MSGGTNAGAGTSFYVLKSGDTPGNLGAQFGTTATAINIINADLIYPGLQIGIPLLGQ